MAALVVETPATNLPVTLANMKLFLRQDNTDDDALITGLIQGATEVCEAFCARSFCYKGYRQSLDAFPYYTDTVFSQLAYPPSYYSLPRYSTTLWNYSQMIKLLVSPLVKVTNIAYLDSQSKEWHSLLLSALPWYPNLTLAQGAQVSDGNGNLQIAQNAGTTDFNPPVWATVLGGLTTDNPGANQIIWQNNGPVAENELGPAGGASNTFFVDADSEPPRLFPGPAGSFWPSVLYVPNAVQIHYTAGYSADGTNVPGSVVTAIMSLVNNWYENREASTPLNMRKIPHHVESMLWAHRVLDFAPTRG